MLDFIISFFDWFVPRFITEDVALVYANNMWIAVLPVKYMEEGEEYHAIAKIRSFNFFGWAVFCKVLETTVIDERFRDKI